jgi:hypothetical protein
MEQNNSKRIITTQITNESALQEKLNLSDTAHASAMSLIKIKDRLFLIDQSGERKGYMAGVDNELTTEEQSSQGERKSKKCHLEDIRKNIFQPFFP